MEFRIADTFTDSLARLTSEEQKAVKTTVFDLQIDPSTPGLSFHKLDKSRDKHFWSVRATRDIRIIVHKTAEASLDEGSLGAVVDLNTGNPLGGKRGLTLVGSAQASYNDLSKNFGPPALHMWLSARTISTQSIGA